jgi:hypothetical protein
VFDIFNVTAKLLDIFIFEKEVETPGLCVKEMNMALKLLDVYIR